MQKKLNKTLKCLCVILTLILNLNIFVACKPKAIKENPYHVYFLDAVLKESFIFAEENRINLGYFNVNYEPRDSESKELTHDKSLPKDRVILLQTEDDLKRAFKTIPDIDMEQKMIVIVFFIGDGYSTEAYIENNVLKISIEKLYSNVSVLPDLLNNTWVMDKIELANIELIFV